MGKTVEYIRRLAHFFQKLVGHYLRIQSRPKDSSSFISEQLLVKIEPDDIDEYTIMMVSQRRLRRVAQWGTLYQWEHILSRAFSIYGLRYDKCICIQAMKTGYEYIAYFTLTSNGRKAYYDAPEWLKFARLFVEFDNKGDLSSTRFELLGMQHAYILRTMHPLLLILDRRTEYDWIVPYPY